MNYLAHFWVATHSVAPVGPLSAYVAGNALPDLLPLAAPRLRLRPLLLASANYNTPSERALTSGVRIHLQTDHCFHTSEAFATAQEKIATIFQPRDFSGIRMRSFFLNHVLTELILDAILLRDTPDLSDQFYTCLEMADVGEIVSWTEGTAGQPLPELAKVWQRFVQAKYLESYIADDGLAAALNGICLRAHQDTFEKETFASLVEVVRRSVEALHPVALDMLNETVTGLKRVLEP